METRLKQRLTGAAILVALIVLLVPEMFHGQRGDVEISPSTGTEGPPLRSYTIDLSNSATRTAPLQSTPAPATSRAPNAAGTTGTVGTGGTGGVTGGSVGVASEAAEPAPMHALVRAPVPGPAPAAHPAAQVWSVQLGMFAQRENAERLLHAAQAKGFAVTLVDSDGKGLYRVHSAGLPDRAAAQALQQRLRADGFAAAVIAP